MQVNINSVQKALSAALGAGFLLARRIWAPTSPIGMERRSMCFFWSVRVCAMRFVISIAASPSSSRAELFARGYNPIIYDGLDELLDRNSSVAPQHDCSTPGGRRAFRPQGHR